MKLLLFHFFFLVKTTTKKILSRFHSHILRTNDFSVNNIFVIRVIHQVHAKINFFSERNIFLRICHTKKQRADFCHAFRDNRKTNVNFIFFFFLGGDFWFKNECFFEIESDISWWLLYRGPLNSFSTYSKVPPTEWPFFYSG